MDLFLKYSVEDLKRLYRHPVPTRSCGCQTDESTASVGDNISASPLQKITILLYLICGNHHIILPSPFSTATLILPIKIG